MPLVTEEQANSLALRMFGRYCELGEAARLNNGTLAELAGISRIRLGQLRKVLAGEMPSRTALGLVSFLRINQLVPRIEAGLAEGWLPAADSRGRAQDVARDRILTAGQAPEGSGH